MQLRWGDDVRTAERATTYQGIAPGQVGLVVDTYGLLSVCLGKRSAADELGMPRRHRGHARRAPLRRRGRADESVPVRFTSRSDA